MYNNKCIIIFSMTSFPLYDSLIKGISTKNLLVKQKNELISNIINFDQSGSELIYTLIRFYGKNDNNDSELPYEAEKVDGKVVFDLEKMPNKLKQILYKFSVLHIENMNAEKRRNMIETF